MSDPLLLPIKAERSCVLPGNKTSDVTPDDADEGAPAGHDDEADEALEDVGVVDVGLLDLDVGLEGVVEDDRDGVVQERLPEHDNVENLVHLKNKNNYYFVMISV